MALSYVQIAASSSGPTNPAASLTTALTPAPFLNTLQIAREAALLIETSKRAVIERFPDKHDDPNSAINILQIIFSIVAEVGCPSPVQVFRHECRSLKIQFLSKSDRDKFIIGFNRARIAHFKELPRMPRARRDLTTTGLSTLRESRKFAYEENEKVMASTANRSCFWADANVSDERKLTYFVTSIIPQVQEAVKNWSERKIAYEIFAYEGMHSVKCLQDLSFNDESLKNQRDAAISTITYLILQLARKINLTKLDEEARKTMEMIQKSSHSDRKSLLASMWTKIKNRLKNRTDDAYSYIETQNMGL